MRLPGSLPIPRLILTVLLLMPASALGQLPYGGAGCIVGDCHNGVGMFQNIEGQAWMGYFRESRLTEGVLFYGERRLYVGLTNGLNREGVGGDYFPEGQFELFAQRADRPYGPGVVVAASGNSSCGTIQRHFVAQPYSGAFCRPRGQTAISFSGGSGSASAQFDLSDRPNREYRIHYSHGSGVIMAGIYDKGDGSARSRRFLSGIQARVGSGWGDASTCDIQIGDFELTQNAGYRLRGAGLCYNFATGNVYFGHLAHGRPGDDGVFVQRVNSR